jgi:Cof subfamily protein (haloacid dehalogenase superfamily)
LKKEIVVKILYVTDLDGTLLNNEGKLSEFTINTINDLVEKGMYFTYATARSLISASSVTKGLHINIPVVTKNGIFIEKLDTKEKIYSLKFTDEEKNNLMKILVRHCIYPMVYSYINGVEKKSWIKDKENEAIKNEIKSLKDDPRYRPVKDINELYNGDVFHINCMGEKNDLVSVYEYIMKTSNYGCLLQKEYYSEHYWCEILPKKATKGNTISVLKEIIKCDKVISFGDGLNDIEMFKVSDESYAVENAENELKKYATGVIKSNENNGVAYWLKNNH